MQINILYFIEKLTSGKSVAIYFGLQNTILL